MKVASPAHSRPERLTIPAHGTSLEALGGGREGAGFGGGVVGADWRPDLSIV